MKSTLLRTFLEWALMTSILMSVGFFAWYLIKSHDGRNFNAQINGAQIHMQYNHNVMNVLAAECQAYARTNAHLARLLTPLAAPAPAVNSKPGAK